MIDYGILRYYGRKDGKPCNKCGQFRSRFFRYHPFRLPASYGRGTWLLKDCDCIKKEQARKRKQLAAFINPPSNDPLPLRLRNYSFTNYKVASYNQEAYKYANQFAQNFRRIVDGKGLLFYGKSGVGKTHLACAIANSLKGNHRVCFAHVPSLLEDLRQRKAISTDGLVEAELLVLDDIGSERETDWTMEKLLIILERRLNDYRPTVFTTNYDLGDFEKRVNMRLSSRILGNSLAVVVQGPDWRAN